MSLDLNAIYSDDVDIEPQILLNVSDYYGYAQHGCIVNDPSKRYLIISAMDNHWIPAISIWDYYE